MSDLISHPLLEVVLQLEYVISWSKATAYTSNSAPGTPYRNADTKDKVCVHNIHVHVHVCFVIAFKAQFYMCTTLMFNELVVPWYMWSMCSRVSAVCLICVCDVLFSVKSTLRILEMSCLQVTVR